MKDYSNEKMADALIPFMSFQFKLLIGTLEFKGRNSDSNECHSWINDIDLTKCSGIEKISCQDFKPMRNCHDS